MAPVPSAHLAHLLLTEGLGGYGFLTADNLPLLTTSIKQLLQPQEPENATASGGVENGSELPVDQS